jgi:hypothetical protein
MIFRTKKYKILLCSKNNRLIFLPLEFIALHEYMGSRDSAVGIATGYRLDFESRWRQEFSPVHVVQTSSGVHPTSYPMGIGGCFSGGKAAVA